MQKLYLEDSITIALFFASLYRYPCSKMEVDLSLTHVEELLEHNNRFRNCIRFLKSPLGPYIQVNHNITC